MRKIIGILLLESFLSGCVTAAERASQLSSADDAACRSYGAVAGSEPYIQCRTTKSQQHEQADATIRAALVGGAPTTCHSSGATTTCY